MTRETPSHSASRPKRPPQKRRGAPRGKNSAVKKSDLTNCFSYPKRFQKEIQKSLDEGSYIVFDIETTGGNPSRNGITEIFAIKWVAGQVKDRFYSMVNPEVPIPPIVRKMTGINNRMVRHAPKIDQVMPEFLEFIGDGILVSHNTIGDLKFLRHFSKACCEKELENFFLCTHLLVDKLVSEAPDKSLNGLSKYFRLPAGNLHRAEADAYVTLELFRILLRKLRMRSCASIEEGIRFQGDYESGMRLGWGVPERSLQQLPTKPGLFMLRDRLGKVSFVSSAINLKSDIQKMANYGQLPRGLLRCVLQSYDVEYQVEDSHLDSMIAESKHAFRYRLNFDPYAWHHRYVLGLNIVPTEEGLEIRFGEAVPGAAAILGPIRDKRVAQEFIESLCKTTGDSFSRKTTVIKKLSLESLLAYVYGRTEDRLGQLQAARNSLLSVLFPGSRQKHQVEIDALEAIRELKVPRDFTGNMLKSGLLVLEREKGAMVYFVSNARIQHKYFVSGDWQAKLAKGGLRRKTLKLIEAHNRESVFSKTIDSIQACEVNAVLWWIHAGINRREGRFYDLKKIQECDY